MKYLIFFLCFYSLFAHADRWNSYDNFARLIHYKNGHSLVKYNDFFLHKNGKNKLKLELRELKKLYNQPESLGDNHPRCKFTDRYFWLNQQIKLSNYQIYPNFCKKLNKWHKSNPVKSISVLFVSGYFDNPASIFGHNLLVLNSGKDPLFDLTLNFGAKVPENENSIFYIVKGLFGGYNARFTDQELYKRDLVYSKQELRDIWDYELNLSTAELTLLKLHIWTIKNKLFNFFFERKLCISNG